MIYFISKTLLSAIIIALISEISKRSSMMGAILASLPLVSVLAMIWLYIDTKNSQAIAELSTDVFWLVLPSLTLFLTLPLFLRYKINFYASLGMAITVMIICYFIMLFFLKQFGIRT